MISTDPIRAWRQLASEFSTLEQDPCRARSLCACYAQAVLSSRDPRRVRFIGLLRLRLAAQEQLEGRDLTAFAMMARACERTIR